MALLAGGGKLPGKTTYAGRRRPMTRTSGFKVHDETTGGQFQKVLAPTYEVARDQILAISFGYPPHKPEGSFVGFGGWFRTDQPVAVQIDNGPRRRTLTTHLPPNWNKFGSIWQAQGSVTDPIRINFSAATNFRIALHGLQGGIVEHTHLQDARIELLPNMYQFAPEGLFITTPGAVTITIAGKRATPADSTTELILKSCNRCGRYLPINIHDERNHLSFSNHCVATWPCKHATFSNLGNRNNSSDRITLKHGYQLECRFCKKFEVNAAHNPQRTSAQMKEDGARRRAFELLIEKLEGGSALLNYRHRTGRELSDDVYKNFGGKCFNCSEPLTPGWHLDHTRPLALLWPLDGTATALCGACNSDKHDRPPAEFYSEAKLEELAKITGLPVAELKDPRPNTAVIRKLAARLDWFFTQFLCSDEMTREHDGKIPGDLLLKALYKALSRSHDKLATDLTEAMKRRVRNANRS